MCNIPNLNNNLITLSNFLYEKNKTLNSQKYDTKITLDELMFMLNNTADKQEISKQLTMHLASCLALCKYLNIDVKEIEYNCIKLIHSFNINN